MFRPRHHLNGTPRAAVGVLAMVLVLAGILLVAGYAASYQVSSARRTLERIESRNLRELAANSAFEEVCARLRTTFAPVPVLRAGQTRDLGATANWPASSTPLTGLHKIEPVLAREDLAKLGVKLPEPVTIQSSAWQVETEDRPDVGKVLQEIGIARLTTLVRITCGGTESTFLVTSLRYFVAKPSETRPELELSIGSKNLGLEVVEQP